MWDGLFWDFIEKHKDLLAKNPRTSMMVKQLSKIDPTGGVLLPTAHKTFDLYCSVTTASVHLPYKRRVLWISRKLLQI